jgi:uncharacterized membrane protein
MTDTFGGDLTQNLIRWIHLIAGVVWIGHLYFFNFVNANFQKTIDGPTKKAVNPELLPRALYFFRWGAMWTLVTGVLLALILYWAGPYLTDAEGRMSMRAIYIHVGAIFGTYMAYNVWMKIWPAQQKIILAVKNGEPPDAGLVAMAANRSKQNTYLSVPLLFLMLSVHHPVTYGTGGIALLIVIVALGFGIVYLLYQKAAQVKGF